ncbi:MAG TPA: hypothetical protein VGS61_03130 [Acidimicrobiales bacterium]|nr:hypothetical protein [Acidimicrobiales bacterium]
MIISAVSMVVGAILYWALTATSTYAATNHGFRVSTIGVILLIAGAAGFVVSLTGFLVTRRPPPAPPRTFDREVVDQTGRRASVHEEQR